MVDARWCNNNLNSGYISFKNVLSECLELLESRTMDEAKEEFGDVLYFTYCWLYSKFKINLPMLGAMGSVYKFVERLEVWRLIFEYHNLQFDTKYLVNGSNYDKVFKVYLALKLARNDQIDSH